MSKSWPTVPLGEVLTKSDERMTLLSDKTYREVTVRLWGKGVVLRREVQGSEIAASRRLAVRKQQFILSRIDARNGAFGIIPDDLDGAIVSNDFPSFTVNPERLEPDYLKWLSRTARFVELCKGASEGTTNRVRLKEDRFLASTIPLPPLPEQRRIVARIEQLAAKIEEARRLKVLFTEDVDNLLPSVLKHLPLSVDCRATTISACSRMSTGTTPPSDREDYFGGPISWYTPGDLSFSMKLGRSSRSITEMAVREGKARLFDLNTVLLVAIGGSLGKVALTHERCSANQQITGIKFSSDILPVYGFWWMRRLRQDLIAAAPQATLPIINQERIGAMEIAIPSLSEQRRIVDYLDSFQTKVDALKRLQAETVAELDALLPSLLDRAFNGAL